MYYTGLLMLFAFATAQADFTSTLTISGSEASVVKEVGESVQLVCTGTTNEWKLDGSDIIVIQKRQGDEQTYHNLNLRGATVTPFDRTSDKVEWSYNEDAVAGDPFIGTVKADIADLKPEDSGSFRCVFIRQGAALGASAELNVSVASPPTKATLGTTSLSSDPNVTRTLVEAGSGEFTYKFNYELNEQVIVTCMVEGGYPAPTVSLTKDGQAITENTMTTSVLSWIGDTQGLKIPSYSSSVKANPFVPRQGDKVLKCMAAPGSGIGDKKSETAKISFGGQLDVSCTPAKAKLEANDQLMKCMIESSDPIKMAEISYKEAKAECKLGQYALIGQGVYCKYEQDASDDTLFTLTIKISNADTGKFQKYKVDIENHAGLKVTAETSLVEDKTGATTGVSGVVPSLLLLAASLFFVL